MSLMHRILCRLGFHHRSRKAARQTEAGWRSTCRWCGQPMLKLKGGDWRIAIQAERPSREDRERARQEEARRRRMPPPPRRRSPRAKE